MVRDSLSIGLGDVTILFAVCDFARWLTDLFIPMDSLPSNRGTASFKGWRDQSAIGCAWRFPRKSIPWVNVFGVYLKDDNYFLPCLVFKLLPVCRNAGREGFIEGLVVF